MLEWQIKRHLGSFAFLCIDLIQYIVDQSLSDRRHLPVSICHHCDCWLLEGMDGGGYSMKYLEHEKPQKKIKLKFMGGALCEGEITLLRWQLALQRPAPGFERCHHGWSCAAPCTACRCWHSPCSPSPTGVHEQDALPAGRSQFAHPHNPGGPPDCTSRCHPCGRSRLLRCSRTAASPLSPWCGEEAANKALHPRW